MINIALVGCAHIHTPGFIKRIKARSDVTVLSVWDHDAARAARSAAECGAQVVADVAEIWRDKRIQAVLVCSETNRHEELVLGAAAAKKHLFVEKPLGFATADAARMATAIRKAKVKFQTATSCAATPFICSSRMRFPRGGLAASRAPATATATAALSAAGSTPNGAGWPTRPLPDAARTATSARIRSTS